MKKQTAKKILISGFVLTTSGFAVIIVCLLNLYDYAGKTCGSSPCGLDAGFDHLYTGVRIGMSLFVFGIVCTIIGGLLSELPGRKTKK